MEKELINIKRYKEIIDNDFEIFPINDRFVQLEKSWIKHISHQIMPSGKGFFMHEDRLKLRKELMKYLKLKISPAMKGSKNWKVAI